MFQTNKQVSFQGYQDTNSSLDHARINYYLVLLGGTSHHNSVDVVGRVANETPVSLAGTTAQSKAGKVCQSHQ